jgi:hypothetical protein
MTFLGGTGTIVGPVIGAIIIEYLDTQSTLLFTDVHGILFGALIVLVTLFLPQGLIRLVQELVVPPVPGAARESPALRFRKGVRRVGRFIAANGI